MGVFSPIHSLIFLIELVIFIVGLVAGGRILRRLGYSPWWVLLALVPIANVVGLWMLSSAVWPNVTNKAA